MSLYICSLPIGNDDDITYRIKACLARIPAIFCEDTRVTHLLLKRLDILGQQQLLRMDQHQESRSFAQFDRLIQTGDVAYVTDAGAPGLSDPGAGLVAHARSKGVSIEVLPGPSSLTAFISGCGVLFSSFYFGGFLPKKTNDIQRSFEAVMNQKTVGIWFESPKRLLATLSLLSQQDPTVPVVLAKELTKPYAAFFSGTVETVLALVSTEIIKGEWLIMVDARQIVTQTPNRYVDIAHALKSADLTARQVKQLAPLFDCKKNELYDYFQQL